MILNADGTTADANREALDMLGVTLDELVALPAGAFSPEPPDAEAHAAFREQWERQGTPDIGGEATLRRLDGSSVRVKFGITPIEEGRFVAVLEPVGATIDAPPVLYTAGQVLAEWRAAERRLDAIPEERPSGAPSATTSIVFAAPLPGDVQALAGHPRDVPRVRRRTRREPMAPPRVERGVREFAATDLPPGEVEVRVGWSSVNYKDGLATRVDGKVARISPIIPGIDLAGEVVASTDPAIAVGVDGPRPWLRPRRRPPRRLREYQRVPGRLGRAAGPRASSTRDAMAIGTAGFTAAMSVVALEERGLKPGDGPVLVTGASGGVGSTAVAILAERGHEVWAATGKPDEADRLRELGAAGILARDEVTAEGKPLESERWAGAVDAVGAATLPYVLRTLRTGAAVAASGNASGPKLDTTVFPFILRGVALLGMDSAQLPIERRRAIWDRLATDLRPRRSASTSPR